MQYGKFDDASKEYVITTPKTPLPWINYLGSENFFSLISNTAGGYSFFKDARMRRITRFRYNNVPLDTGGRYFYINDENSIWSPGFRPVNAELDFYECRHGLGYTKICGEKNGIRANVTFYVPFGETAEIQHVKLENRSSKSKSFKLFSFVEFCLWEANDDMTNFQRNLNTGEVEIEGSVIYHKTEYRERRNHFAFYSVNAPVAGFDSDRESFLGAYNGFHNPQVVADNKSKNSVASGWSPVASHCLEISLNPGESKEFVFVLGYVENDVAKKWSSPGVINKENAYALIKKYDSPTQVEKDLNALSLHWEKLLNNYIVKSPDPILNRIVNIWNPYQCMVTFNLSRSASYFESGIGRGMGFRDSNQDTLGFVHQIPTKVRERILDIAATQLRDGGAYHQYQPLTKRGNELAGNNFNDDPLWLIHSVSSYLKETGDVSILKEQVPYENLEELKSEMSDHLKRAFNHVINNLGPHGLPLIGRADWNDCLNLNCYSEEPGESYQTGRFTGGKIAESLLIAGMFVFIGKEYVQICNHIGNKMEADRAELEIQKMESAILKDGWDGEWFLRAYDGSGNKIGSSENDEGKIFIESQGWCSMAEVGKEKGYTKKSLDSVKKHLDTKYGIVLNQPPYSVYRKELGEITSYPPGYKENASIFSHNNPWIIIAETILGRADAAMDYYKKLAPPYLEQESEIHRSEPYVFAQTIAGKDAVRHGEAKNSWLTGAAAWTYVAVSKWMLGVRPDISGLIVDPCIPADWKEFSVSRMFRGARYDINVQNPNSVQKGVIKMTVDGKQIVGNLIPAFSDNGVHIVEITMG